jgi:drug/metabolite transporter (DMT)-like permease
MSLSWKKTVSSRRDADVGGALVEADRNVRPDPHSLWLVAAAAATGILVGAAMVATRFVIGQTAPASLAFLRYLIGCCCLLPPLLLSDGLRFARRDLVPIGLLGITQFGILIALLNYGLQYIPSARAALIFATVPLLTMLLATFLGHEQLTVAKQGGATRQWIGELAVLASALCGAVCSVLYRPYLRKYPPVAISTLAMLSSVGFLAVLAAGEGFFDAWPGFTRGGWLAVLFIGASSGIGYYLWLWALKHTTPTKVTVFLALGPITAALLGGVFLEERITAMSWVGVAGVALGLWLAHREGSAAAVPHGKRP